MKANLVIGIGAVSALLALLLLALLEGFHNSGK